MADLMQTSAAGDLRQSSGIMADLRQISTGGDLRQSSDFAPMPITTDLRQSAGPAMSNMPDLRPLSDVAALLPGLIPVPTNDMGIVANSSPTSVEPKQSVSNSCRVSPPHAQELHHKFFYVLIGLPLLKNLVDTALHIKKVDFRSLSPPLAFDMHAIQHEIRRLSQDQTDIQNTLHEQQAQVTIVSEHTGIDPSAFLPPFMNSTSLSECLASLEEMTRRLQDVESAGDRLAEQVKTLETLSWFKEERRMNAHNARIDRFEELHQAQWKDAKARLEQHEMDLCMIRVQHEAFEGEVRNMMKVTPAALQEQVKKSMAKLTNRVHQAKLAQDTLTTSYRALTKGQIKLGNRQMIVEQIVLNYFRCKVMTDAQIDATKGTADIGINMLKDTMDIGVNTDQSAEESVQATSLAPIQSAAPTPAQALSPAPVQSAAVQVSSLPPISTAPNLVQAESPAPIYLAPKPVRATHRSRSPSPFTVGTRRSPWLIASSDDHPITPTNEDPQ